MIKGSTLQEDEVTLNVYTSNNTWGKKWWEWEIDKCLLSLKTSTLLMK